MEVELISAVMITRRIMDLIGKSVSYSQHKEGVITAFDGEFVEVHFLRSNETKTFLYPNCFRGKLELLDGSLNDTIESDIQNKKVEAETRKVEQAKKI